MKIAADMHCHTLASTHAYSTLMEMARYAKERGDELLAITDHGPAMNDAPHIWHFVNSWIWPKVIEGITVIPGVEANVMDFDGKLDMPDDVLQKLPWVIASCHREVVPSGTVEDHTRMWLEVAKNPHVDLIGHCGQRRYDFDKEKVIKAFKEYGKIVEINNNSRNVRQDSIENCVEIAKLCKKYQVPVCVDSDAHICFEIGNVGASLQMLEEIGFPQELILNLEGQRITDFIRQKKGKDYPVFRG